MFFDNEYDELKNSITQRNLVVPTTTLIQVDLPSSKASWYYDDCKRSARLGSRRNQFIRVSLENEFETSYGLHPLFPKLWVKVQRESGIHFRHAFWRGDQPFALEPTSDAEVMTIFANCILDNGIGREAFRRFFRHNQ